MAQIILEFEVPDPHRPIPGDRRGPVGPSAELVPFFPSPIVPAQVVGRHVDQVSLYVGTYGMGGPGFFGLRLGPDWLVVSLWGASEWILVDDRLVADWNAESYGRPLPWVHVGGDELSGRLVGSTLAAFSVQSHSLEIRFSNGAVMVIDEDPQRRPILEGKEQPRTFSPEDDLRKAVFLSPTAELWI